LATPPEYECDPEQEAAEWDRRANRKLILREALEAALADERDDLTKEEVLDVLAAFYTEAKL
jgi:hypothetical protein